MSTQLVPNGYQDAPLSREWQGGPSGAFGNSASDSGEREFSPTYWDSPSRLTFSLASDKTAISDYSSTLFESFSHMMNAEQLKAVIANAFQSWALRSNLNFGYVADSGDSFGIGGQTQGDSRFGDIRFGAIPMGAEVFAVSIPQDEATSGTWAGDILFNSKAVFESINHFKSVAIHEIGHSLGMEHSDNVRSVMHFKSRNLRLAGSDIANLQTIYGERQLDQYDIAGDRNDTLQDATRIKHSGSLRGSIPFVVYGDIENSSDVDYFYLRPVNDYTGSVSFRVVSDGISLLRTQIALFDENGTLLRKSNSSSTFGSDHTVTINSNGEDDVYVRIQRIGSARNKFGSYALVATFNGLAKIDGPLLEQTIRADLSQLEQDDVQSIFIEPIPVFNDDLHTNDTLPTATDLELVPGIESQHVYRVQAGLSDSLDIDYYQFVTPDFGAATGVLTARIFAEEQGGLISKLAVFNSTGKQLLHRVVSNGNGGHVIQVDRVESERSYFVRVVADQPTQGYDIGNYDLKLSFDREAYQLQNFGGGQIGVTNTAFDHSLYVAETQLFHFGLVAAQSQTYVDSTIWMTVYAESGKAVYRTATRPGEFRSAKSIILQPGSYSIKTTITFGSTFPFETKELLKFQIKGKNIGDPIGPELINPANLPFPKCNPKTDEYCYPGDRHTEDPFIMVSGNEVSLPPGSSNPPPYENINVWYWYQNWLGDPA